MDTLIWQSFSIVGQFLCYGGRLSYGVRDKEQLERDHSRTGT